MNELARTIMTIGCRDCDPIPKVADAGRIVEAEGGERFQIMHNGLRVVAGGYHGDWMAQIIRGLKGYHEPQEERVFHALLPFVRHNSLMVELGAFWAYYTLWFLHDVPGSRALCVEPDPASLAIGKRNVALNACSERVEFHEAWVGDGVSASLSLACESTGEPRTLPNLNMQALQRLTEGRFVEILHIDAQGAETPFLRSIDPTMAEGLRFVVASTHHRSISGSPHTHEDCLEHLRALGAHVLVEHDVAESFSGDGLIVASFMDEDRELALPDISRNTFRNSLFATA